VAGNGSPSPWYRTEFWALTKAWLGIPSYIPFQFKVQYGDVRSKLMTSMTVTTLLISSPRKAFHLLSETPHTGFGGIDEVATA